MNHLTTQTLVLCCTDCQHIFEPNLVATLSNTGCERCGGWTWIAQREPLQVPQPRLPETGVPHESNQPLDTERRKK